MLAFATRIINIPDDDKMTWIIGFLQIACLEILHFMMSIKAEVPWSCVCTQHEILARP